MVTEELVQELKNSLHITNTREDDYIKKILSSSIAYLRSVCGDIDIENNENARELVIERARYSYNDAVEYFEDNFLSQIHNLGMTLVFEGDENEEV